MKNINQGYELFIQGIEMHADGKKDFVMRLQYDTLKQAVRDLNRLGNFSFDPAVVAQHQLPRLIKDAVISDNKDYRVVLRKYHLPQNAFYKEPSSIYLRINGSKIDAETLKREAGLDLTRYPKMDGHPDYNRVATTERLLKQFTPLRKIARKAARVLSGIRNRGPHI